MPRLAIAALLAALPLAPASAAPLGGEEIRARTAGGEFRGFGATRRNPLEDVIFRFRPDGTLMSVSQFFRTAGGGMGTGQLEQYGDTGSWRVEGARLCVALASVHRDLSGCYGVEGDAGNQVRLVGPVQLRGTLGR
jgi:hypothetical protein